MTESRPERNRRAEAFGLAFAFIMAPISILIGVMLLGFQAASLFVANYPASLSPAWAIVGAVLLAIGSWVHWSVNRKIDEDDKRAPKDE